jgi:hypothetical protein
MTLSRIVGWPTGRPAPRQSRRSRDVEHQHFNLDPAVPAIWAAFIHIPIQECLAPVLRQTEFPGL